MLYDSLKSAIAAKDTIAVDHKVKIEDVEYKVADAEKFKALLAAFDATKEEKDFVEAFKAAKETGLEKVEVKKDEPKKDADKGGFLSTLWSHVTCPFKSGYAFCTASKTRTALSVFALGLAVTAVACRMNGTSLTTVCSKLFENATGRSL